MTASLLVRNFAVLVSASLLLTCIGCNKPTSNVQGKVTFNGKPVTVGSVMVFGPDGHPHTAQLNEEGTYSVKDIPSGQAQFGVVSRDPEIAIRQMEANMPPAPKDEGDDKDSEAKEPPKKNGFQDEMLAKLHADKERWFPIPQKYADPVTANITSELKPGDNTYDIEMSGIAEERRPSPEKK